MYFARSEEKVIKWNVAATQGEGHVRKGLLSVALCSRCPFIYGSSEWLHAARPFPSRPCPRHCQGASRRAPLHQWGGGGASTTDAISEAGRWPARAVPSSGANSRRLLPRAKPTPALAEPEKWGSFPCCLCPRLQLSPALLYTPGFRRLGPCADGEVSSLPVSRKAHSFHFSCFWALSGCHSVKDNLNLWHPETRWRLSPEHFNSYSKIKVKKNVYSKKMISCCRSAI